MEKKTTNMLVNITAIIFILVGACLLFVPQINLTNICYFLCASIVIAGIYMIVRYFLADGFKENSNYGFSIGVFCTVLGIIGFIKTNDIIGFFPAAIGILVLVLGVVLLQDSLDLKRMNNGIWVVIGVISLVVIGAAVICIINPFPDATTRQTVVAYLIFVDGILTILSKLIVMFSLRGYNKALEKRVKTAESELQGKVPEEGPKKELEEKVENSQQNSAQSAKTE